MIITKIKIIKGYTNKDYTLAKIVKKSEPKSPKAIIIIRKYSTIKFFNHLT